MDTNAEDLQHQEINKKKSLFSEKKSAPTQDQFMNVKSTFALKNELKLLRTFKVDLNLYSQFRSEEEKQSYLLKKMEEDI
mmetsp:Transcript_7675/g.7073  ORF Transcript_7675/g.7073 Transcript_7675/m.7073 type:complete len:80 (+) Transcript_7675:562-801(+)